MGDFCMESCVDSKDRHVLSGSIDGDIWCWDLVQATVTNRLTHDGGNVVHSLSFHPSQLFLLSACQGSVKLWGVPDDTL